jgi:hypothetical protein
MTTAHQPDIVDDIITDHREVEEVFAEIEKGGGGNKRELVEHVITELVRHSFERPPANKILGPGVGRIDRMRDALSGRNS